MERSRLSKVIETIWLFWGFMMPGVGDAVLGPTLLDLQLLINVKVDRFSYLILASGTGAVTGSVLAGLIFTNVNKNLKLAIVILLGSITNAITPAVSNYIYFLFMFGLQGLCRGFIACYLLEVCNTLWEHKGTAFQFLYCGATTGSILTPLIVRPFLCVPDTRSTQSYGFSSVTVNPSLGNGSDISGDCQASDTHVQFAYLVLGLLTMPSGLAFMYYWMKARKEHDSEAVSQYENLSRHRTVRFTKTKLQFVYLITLFCFYFPLLGNNILYTTFLTAFGVDGPLHISKSSMVYMTSLFWGSFLFSRVGNTLLSPCCGNFKIVLINTTVLLFTGVVLISLAGRYEPALWITTIALGLFSGPLQGAALGWTENFMKIEAKVISVTVLGVGAGALALPFVGGMLFHYAPPMGHFYLVFAMILFICLMFFILNILGSMIRKEVSLSENEIKMEETESGDSSEDTVCDRHN